MNDDAFARLHALNPTVIDTAKTVAANAVAAMPADLQPAEEPAHVYQVASTCADEAERRA